MHISFTVHETKTYRSARRKDKSTIIFRGFNIISEKLLEH